jgi:ribokinase
MSGPKIVVVGSSNMDIYTWTGHLPEHGETVIGERYWMGMGGKGANQAVGSRRLGAESTIVGRIGQDLFGQQMLETLRSHGVNCDFIKLDPEAGSGVALVIVDERGENIIAVIPGTNMRIAPSDVEAAAGKIREADVVMAQLEIPLEAIEKAFDIALEGDTLCILNPAPARPLPGSILGKVNLLTPNQNEAKVLTGIATDTVDGARTAANALLEKGVQTVIVTMGTKGALIVRPGEALHIDAIRVDSIDTSGAGDAFMAGLGVALAEGRSLDEATRFANAVGALSTTRPGAMPSMPDRSEVDDLLRQMAN